MSLSKVNVKYAVAGGAAALAAALFHSNKIDCENVIIVATGGNIDKETFTKALTNYN